MPPATAVSAESNSREQESQPDGSLKPGITDGPRSPRFRPIALPGSASLRDLADVAKSGTMQSRAKAAPKGVCTCWGIPFSIDRVVVSQREPQTLKWADVHAPWFVCLHTTDVDGPPRDAKGFIKAPRGAGLLNEHVADYVFLYGDGSEARVEIRRRHQVGMLARGWGENCFEAVAQQKPFPVRTTTEHGQGGGWGWSQTRVSQPDGGEWVNWLWAWRNPHPDKSVIGLRIEPKTGVLILSAITSGDVSDTPLRWESRRKAIVRLPEGTTFERNLKENGISAHIALDLGQVISVSSRLDYANADWEQSYNNKPPSVLQHELLVEYAAHPDALFHLPGGRTVPVAELSKGTAGPLIPVAPATQRVRFQVRDKSGKPAAVKLHIHGRVGEYLPPVDRHRIPNPYWYEDYSVDFINEGRHYCTYIAGDANVDLPIGDVFVEISKGFEIRPIRKIVRVEESTTQLRFTIERVLRWRDRGWVTADTHVHFLSPPSAHLEGAGEGVNVVNLLASQWGELMTNVGDFDGKSTYGSREAGGDGEYLVRVGTENRQHVLGHISLLGYNGQIIAPMTVGGPDESALGDPVEILLTEWARQCKKQGGVVVLPHFPNPRAEHAASIVSGDIDAVEMTSWSNLYAGIDPYSLSDWYRYLNNGYFVAAVGGTDKMEAATAVGAVRTYARIPKGRRFDYDAWKQAVRAGHTFVTYGPLMEFAVEGKPPGTRMKMGRSGGTVDVSWQLASVTVPMSRVELVVNGEIRESKAVDEREDKGSWSVKIDRSSWLALMVRGHYSDRREIIAAHSSPVMMEVGGLPFFSAADSLTILEQIEGALNFLDNIGTRTDATGYKRMRLVLTGAHRSLHNRLHQNGVLHHHNPCADHSEHH